MLKYHIKTVDISSTQASISFDSIPQDYTDLLILVSGRGTQDSAAEEIRLTFNGLTSNISTRQLYAYGTSVVSNTVTNQGGGVPSATTTANTFGNTSIYISNYTLNSNKSYSVDSVSENNSSTVWFQNIVAGLWSNTAPLTSISLYVGLGSWAAGTSISLYGVRRGSDGVVNYPASGGTVTTSGGYTYHTFTSSGNLVVSKDLTAEVLVVAGGGAGGSYYGGGGGAGGVSYKSSAALASGSTANILVGAGGSGAGATPIAGANGNISQFQGVISNGGGGGGSWISSVVVAGKTGGSGGGGPMGVAAGNTGPAGASNQGSTDGATGFGNSGGGGYRGSTGTAYRGGGGGGAGSVGTTTPANNDTSPGSNGGAGLNTWSSWASATSTGQSGFYAGGGGGGVVSGTSGQGGVGGGGNGDNGGGNSTPGAANTGGGGGADTASGLGAAAGGSGVVIIRYLTP